MRLINSPLGRRADRQGQHTELKGLFDDGGDWRLPAGELCLRAGSSTIGKSRMGQRAPPGGCGQGRRRWLDRSARPHQPRPSHPPQCRDRLFRRHAAGAVRSARQCPLPGICRPHPRQRCRVAQRRRGCSRHDRPACPAQGSQHLRCRAAAARRRDRGRFSPPLRRQNGRHRYRYCRRHRGAQRPQLNSRAPSARS